jgi:hypothetical protein
MRHSDINLTMSRYTHVLRGQLSEAVAGLPDFNQSAAPARNGPFPLPILPASAMILRSGLWT